jgi:hypothetical protein
MLSEDHRPQISILSRAEALALAAQLQDICYQYRLSSGKTLQIGKYALIIGGKEYWYMNLRRCIVMGPRCLKITKGSYDVLSLDFDCDVDTESLARLINERIQQA